MPLQYIDLSERHGHRDDHGFSCGAEFNVKMRRRIDIPAFVRDQLSQATIDSIWWDVASQKREELGDALRQRFKWIGQLVFVGRGPGWLAIEDTGCKTRNWDTIGKVVEKHLKEFVKDMEDPRAWRDVRGVQSSSHGEAHATKQGRSTAGKRAYQYRAVVGGKGVLLGGTKRHASSWFKTKKEADDWAWAIHTGNESVGRSVDYVTIERKHGGVVEHVPWAHAGEVEV